MRKYIFILNCIDYYIFNITSWFELKTQNLHDYFLFRCFLDDNSCSATSDCAHQTCHEGMTHECVHSMCECVHHHGGSHGNHGSHNTPHNPDGGDDDKRLVLLYEFVIS